MVVGGGCVFVIGQWWMVRGVPCGLLSHCVMSSWSSRRIVELRWLGLAMKNKKIKLKKHTVGPNNAFLMHCLGHRYIGGGGWWFVIMPCRAAHRHHTIRFYGSRHTVRCHNRQPYPLLLYGTVQIRLTAKTAVNYGCRWCYSGQLTCLLKLINRRCPLQLKTQKLIPMAIVLIPLL